jgi:hypothetical protein
MSSLVSIKSQSPLLLVPHLTQGKLVALPSAPHDPVESIATILPEQLRDRANDDLKAHDPELVTAYKVFSREFDDAPTVVLLHSGLKPTRLNKGTGCQARTDAKTGPSRSEEDRERGQNEAENRECNASRPFQKGLEPQISKMFMYL